MKTAILLIYIICVLVFSTQGEVQEFEYTTLCAECKRSTLPKCEIGKGVRFHKMIDCKRNGCTIGVVTNDAVDFMCMIDAKSLKSQLPEKNNYSPKTNVLPVPLVLQMIKSTESSKANAEEINNEEENGGSETEKEAEVDAKIEQKDTVEATIDGKENKKDPIAEREDKAAEKGNEPKQTEENQEPLKKESEIENDEIEKEDNVNNEGKIENNKNTAQSVEKSEAIEPTIEENDKNKESLEVSMEDDKNNKTPVATASVGEVKEEEPQEGTAGAAVSVEPDKNSNSPDYPADEPETNENEELNKPTSGEKNNISKEQPNTSKSSTESVNYIIDANIEKKPESHTEPAPAASGGESVDTSEPDKPEYMSGGETEKHPDNLVTPRPVSDGEKMNATTVKPTISANTLAPPMTVAQIFTCYSCTSTTDMQCVVGPGKLVNCQAVEKKQNGCYTLYKADTNITSRGCISELTDAGLKYCQTNVKQCILCHEKECNNRMAPSAAIRSSPMMNLWVGIATIISLRYLL